MRLILFSRRGFSCVEDMKKSHSFLHSASIDCKYADGPSFQSDKCYKNETNRVVVGTTVGQVAAPGPQLEEAAGRPSE